jgi:hypothetical protein
VLDLPFEQVKAQFQEATRLYEDEKVPFKSTFKKLLNRATAKDRVVIARRSKRRRLRSTRRTTACGSKRRNASESMPKRKSRRRRRGGGRPIEARRRT